MKKNTEPSWVEKQAQIFVEKHRENEQRKRVRKEAIKEHLQCAGYIGAAMAFMALVAFLIATVVATWDSASMLKMLKARVGELEVRCDDSERALRHVMFGNFDLNKQRAGWVVTNSYTTNAAVFYQYSR